MIKLFVLLLSVGVGAASAAAWLLSEPEAAPASSTSVSSVAGDRLGELKVRFSEALAEGTRAGAETESRLRGQLNTYRRPPAAR